LSETGKLFASVQGRNEGVTIFRAPNHYGGARWLPRTQKTPDSVTNIFFSRVHLLSKDLRFEHGGAKLASCPGPHLYPLHPCWRTNVVVAFHTLQYGSVRVIIVPTRNSSTYLIVAKLRCRRTAERTALIADLKLVFRFTGFQNLASVLSFPYLLPSYLHFCFSFQSCHHALKKWICNKNRPILHNPTGSPELCQRKRSCLWLLGSGVASPKIYEQKFGGPKCLILGE